MAKASRDKGKRGERWLATKLREWFPEFAKSIVRGRQSRGASNDEQDVKFPLIWWEMKSGKKQNPRAALAQAIEDVATNGGEKIPVACVKDDRKDAFVVLLLDDFLFLLKDGNMKALKKAYRKETTDGRRNKVLRDGGGREVLSRPGGRRWKPRIRASRRKSKSR